MSIPNLPPFYKMKWTGEDGEMTVDSLLYSDDVSQTLLELVDEFNQNFDSGLEVPNKTTAEITSLEPAAPIGVVWFNTSIAKLQVKTASGIIETITSS